MPEKIISKGNRAERLARVHGISKRTLYRWVKFADAVQTLADMYGQDMLNCLLDRDRQVRLTHPEIIKLAAIASSRPQAFSHLGDIIRAGDTQYIKYVLYGD